MDDEYDFADIDELRQVWQPMVQSLAISLQAGTGISEDLLAYMQEISGEPLGRALKALMEGQRDPVVLLRGLAGVDRMVMEDLIAALVEAADEDLDSVESYVKQWLPLSEDVAAVALGQEPLERDLPAILQDLGEAEEWADLIEVLRMILDGERDLALLTAGLDAIDSAIVFEVMSRIGVTPETMRMAVVSQLLEQVALACGPDSEPEFVATLLRSVSAMADNEGLAPELRLLGGVLGQILAGERAPDLTGLADPLRQKVSDQLRRL